MINSTKTNYTKVFVLVIGIFMLVSLVGLLSCNRNLNKIKVAEQVTDRYYSYFVNNHLDSIKSLFSNSYYRRRDTTYLLKTLQYLHDSMGALESYQLIESKLTYSLSGKGQEKVIIVTYKCVYQPGNYVAKEDFTFTLDGDFNAKIDRSEYAPWKDEL